MNKKKNKLYQESDSCMKQAILTLIDTVPYEKITVRMVCEKAGVNRSTFYAHYLDINDLLAEIEENLHRQLMNEYYKDATYSPLSAESMIPFLHYIQDHQYFYKVALRARTRFPIKRSFQQVWDHVVAPFCIAAGITDEEEMLYLYTGFQASFTFILRRWVEHNCQPQPEELARILVKSLPRAWPQ